MTLKKKLQIAKITLSEYNYDTAFKQGGCI